MNPIQPMLPMQRRLARAFSLVELALVLAIMAVAAAMAVPRYGNALMQYRAQAAAERIAADMRLIQQLAKQTSAKQTMAFDTAKGTYGITGMVDINRSAQKYSVDLTKDPYRATITMADFAGTATLEYDGYGMPKAGGVIIVQVGTFTRTVAVDAASGKGSIQ